MDLPIKKLYIDSAFRTADSKSASSFKIELPQTLTFPDPCIFLIDDICIPHSWYTVETDFNDRLYLRVQNLNLGSFWDGIIQIHEGNYTGASLANAIQSAINNTFYSRDKFYCSYDINTNQLKIGQNDRSLWYQILTDFDISTRLNGVFNPSQAYNPQTPKSINQVIGNYGATQNGVYYADTNPFVSSFLILNGPPNLYLSSPNLGTFNSLAANSNTIIKKIPVTSDFGYMIIDRVQGNHDYMYCSKQTIRTLEFNLRDASGNLIPLHGCNISFSIVFSTSAEQF